jgi:hypothetical protein
MCFENFTLTMDSQTTSNHHIKSYASACMHNNIAKSYDKF